MTDIDEKIAAAGIESTLAGNAGGSHVAVRGPADQVVTVEQVVGSESDAEDTSAAVVCWLFRAAAAPSQFGLEQLPEIVADDGNLAWVDLCNVSEGKMHDIAGLLQFTEIESGIVLSGWRRPRLQASNGRFLTSVTVATLTPETLQVTAHQLDLFVSNNLVLSAHRTPLPFSARILARARQSPDLVRLDSAFMLYIILDELLAYYEDLHDELGAEIEEMEERALTDTSDEFLSDLIHFKRYVTALARLVAHHLQVFSAFRRPDFKFVSGAEISEYYRDLEERLLRLLGALETAQDSVNGAFDIYVSHMSHRTNQIIKVLTIVSTILLPTSVIVSFFSTSFQRMPFYSIGGFVVMLVLIVAVSGGILFAFRRQGWL